MLVPSPGADVLVARGQHTEGIPISTASTLETSTSPRVSIAGPNSSTLVISPKPMRLNRAKRQLRNHQANAVNTSTMTRSGSQVSAAVKPATAPLTTSPMKSNTGPMSFSRKICAQRPSM